MAPLVAQTAYSAEPKVKKEKKEEKKSKSKSRELEASLESALADASTEQSASKKRKRDPLPEEIEIDLKLPEPVSKKELRKAKKAKSNPRPANADDDDDDAGTSSKVKTEAPEENKASQRSEHGVWIGNLPWSATKDTLRTFLTSNTEILPDQITRVHMPAPTKPPNPHWTTKPLNKGFAYVDFSTQLAMYSAIALTETKMDGRPLLIKNAKSFEGRPDKPAGEEGGEEKNDGKPPNKRVFVGNLAFDVTKEDLLEHYGQCGEIANLHVATFEDTGKCKGYAWITFEDIEAAKAAVKGFIFKVETKKEDANGSGEDAAPKKTSKRKWYINRLRGRELRCEFAEDSTTRYNKRFGKEKKEGMEEVHPDRIQRMNVEDRKDRPRVRNENKEKRRKLDPRTIKPGAAQMNAPRASQAIVASQGKKITFE